MREILLGSGQPILDKRGSSVRKFAAVTLGVAIFVFLGVVFASAAIIHQEGFVFALFLVAFVAPTLLPTYLFTKSANEAVVPALLIGPVGFFVAYLIVNGSYSCLSPSSCGNSWLGVLLGIPGSIAVALAIPGVVIGLFGGWLGGRRALKNSRAKQEATPTL